MLVNFKLGLYPIGMFRVRPSRTFKERGRCNLNGCLISFLFRPITRAISNGRVEFLVSNGPSVVSIAVGRLFGFATKMSIIRVNVRGSLRRRPKVMETTTTFLVRLPRAFGIRTLGRDIGRPG